MRAGKHAAHRRRRSDGAPARRPGRRGPGRRDHNGDGQMSRGDREGRTRSETGGASSRLSAAPQSAARAPRQRQTGASRRRLSRAKDDCHAPRSARQHGVLENIDGRDTLETRPTDQPVDSFTRRPSLVPKRRSSPRPPRQASANSSCDVRTARRGTVSLPDDAWRRSDRRRHIDDSCRGGRAPAWRSSSSLGRLHRGWELACRGGGHRRGDRGTVPVPRISKSLARS